MDDIRASARSAPLAGSRDFKRLRVTLIGAALCVAGLSLAGLFSSADDARRKALTQAQDKADNLVVSLGLHSAHSFNAVRVVLRMAAMDHADRMRRVTAAAEMNATLAELVSEAPILDSMQVLDGVGSVVADSRPPPARPFNSADRAYFQAHRDDPARGFFVSEPVRGKVIDEWRIVASHGLADARGRFQGVVMGVMSPERIATVFRGQNPDRALAITLYRDDGIVLARDPHDSREVGEKSAEFGKFEPADGETRHTFTALSTGERRVTYRAIDGLPLVVAVSYDTDAVLAPWRRSLASYAGWAAGSVAVTLVVMLMLLVMLQQRERAARALAFSEERLSDLVGTMSDWVWEQDAELRFTFVADHHLKRVGLDASKMLGKRREEIAADPDTEEMRRHKEDLAARRPFRDLLVGRRLDDGRVVYFQISGKPMFDESGRFRGYRGTGRDITDIKNAEMRAEASAAEVERSRDLLRAVLNSVPARIHLKDIDRRYMMVNDEQLKQWGVKLDEVLGKRFEELPVAAIDAGDRKRRADDMAAKEKVALASGKTETFYQDVYSDQHRSVRSYLATKTPLLDAQGSPNAILTVATDVTDIKRAETQATEAAAELKRSRDLLQAVLDTVPASISVKDAGRRFVLTNKSQIEAWNIETESVRGKRIGEIDIPGMAPAALKEFVDSIDARDISVLATGRPILSHEDVLPGADGQPVNWMSSKVPLRDADGRPNGILSVAVDVTAIKRAETQAKTAAAELKKNRDLLQAVLDNVPARVSVKDRDRRYMLVNKFGLESWGVTQEQAIGRRREEFHSRNTPSSDDRVAAMVAKRDERILETGEPLLFYEESWPDADGVERHHLVSKVPLRDDAGAVESVMTVSMDITPMKQAEMRAEAALAELKKNSELLQAVLDAVPALINVKDNERRYILMNKAHLKDYRLSLDAVLGKRLEEIAVPTIKPEEFPAFAARVAASDEALLQGGEGGANFEEAFTDPEGRQVHWLTSKIPLSGADGKRYAILTAAIDITDRKQAELRTAHANQRLADYVDTSSDWFWETDAEHRFSYMSDGLRRVLGIDPAVVIGKLRSDIALDQAQDPAKWSRHMDDLRAHRPYRNLVFHAEIGGRRIYISSSGKPVFDAQDRFTGYRGIGRDVTAEVELKSALIEAKDAAEVASRAKSEFLANMSHELRTPLNAVIGFSDMLTSGLMGALNAKQNEYLCDIGASGRHLLDIINDVLDLAKIEAGRMVLREELLDVPGMVEDCMRLVRERAHNGGIELEQRIQPALRLRADILAVKKILTNLLSNAVKFTAERGRVTVQAGINAAGECVLSVSDTGIGMAPPEVEKALEPFGQVDSTLTRRHQGTGLGLPLAVSLAEAMGGRLVIDSEPGRGTIVTVALPAERVLHSAA